MFVSVLVRHLSKAIVTRFRSLEVIRVRQPLPLYIDQDPRAVTCTVSVQSRLNSAGSEESADLRSPGRFDMEGREPMTVRFNGLADGNGAAAG